MQVRLFLRAGIIIMNVLMIMMMITVLSCSSQKQYYGELYLDKGWFIQQGTNVAEKGAQISLAGFSAKNWIPANVPATVLGALADYGVYSDIYYAKNLETIPKDQFKTSWWYRKEFDLGDSIEFENASAIFEGINYYANIWLNGEKIASADSIKGAFRVFEMDITKHLRNGKNILAVEVLPPKPGDFYMGFVDWAPPPPDDNMGLFRPVKIKWNGIVSFNHVYVRSKVNLKTLDEAALTIEADLMNHTQNNVSAVLRGKIANIEFEQSVALKPLERKKVIFDPQVIKELNIKKPKLWWPYQYGDPNMYKLTLQCKAGGKVSDKQEMKFGIREVSDYLNEFGNRGYMVNGKKIQIRGGGWADDLLLRENEKNVEAQVQLTKQMNLNTIRLEGFWGSSQKLYDLCDKYGILLMTGWSCQWEWEHYIGGKACDDYGAVKSPEDIALVSRMMKDQVIMFRNHPSIYVWVHGSDKLPRPELEKKYFENLKEIDPTRPALGSCSNRKSEVSGPTGVKMEGPYDYVTPNYWYLDTKHGGAYGFNTETGPGPQVPPLESLQKMIPEDKLWPVNDFWDYHCGRNEFNTINRYMNALNNRYGKASDINEFLMKAQVANYEAIRGMFEAFAVNKAKATGIIQWMLNAAWPKLYWQLYDYFLMPNGAFYGTQAACKPVNIIYNYGDGNIYVSNDLYHPIKNASAEIRIFDMNSKEILNQKVPFDIYENLSKKIFDMPPLKGITPTYFLELKINARDSSEIARNFYWLSAKPDVLDEAKSDWYFTPNKSFADFTALNKLPKTSIEVKPSYSSVGEKQTLTLKLRNRSDIIAFFIDLRIKTRNSDELVLPVYWTENYISLLPGEEREVKATVNIPDLKGEEPVFEYSGWNLKK